MQINVKILDLIKKNRYNYDVSKEIQNLKKGEREMIKFLEIFFGLLSIVGTLMTMVPMVFVSLASWFVLLNSSKVKSVGSWLSFIGMVALFVLSLTK